MLKYIFPSNEWNFINGKMNSVISLLLLVNPVIKTIIIVQRI